QRSGAKICLIPRNGVFKETNQQKENRYEKEDYSIAPGTDAAPFRNSSHRLRRQRRKLR
ncbi:hypothetical protein GOGPGP_GOGPGP_15550, partial [Dysosmobacter welbionis]